MNIEVTYYGQTSELVGEGSQHIVLSGSINSTEFLKHLKDLYPTLENIDLKIAVNNKFVTEDVALNEGDSVSVLPPFSGG